LIFWKWAKLSNRLNCERGIVNGELSELNRKFQTDIFDWNAINLNKKGVINMLEIGTSQKMLKKDL